MGALECNLTICLLRLIFLLANLWSCGRSTSKLFFSSEDEFRPTNQKHQNDKDLSLWGHNLSTEKSGVIAFWKKKKRNLDI